MTDLVPAAFATVGGVPLVVSKATFAALPGLGTDHEIAAHILAAVAREVRAGLKLEPGKVRALDLGGVRLFVCLAMAVLGPTALCGLVIVLLPGEEGRPLQLFGEGADSVRFVN